MFFNKNKSRSVIIETLPERRKKILVLGKKFANKEIYSYDWFSIPDKINLADFDIVLFDLHIIQNKTNCIYPKFSSIINNNYWNLVFNENAKIYIFGTPSSIKTSESEWGSYTSASSLLAGEIDWTNQEGDIIKNVSETFQDYFSSIKKWNFNFQNNYHKPQKYIIDQISETISFSIIDFSLEMSPLALNNYDKAIAAKFNLNIEISKGKVKKSAPIFWLPIDNEKYLEIFLEKNLNINEKQKQPEWMRDHSLKSIDCLKEEINEIDQRIMEICNEKENLENQLSEREELLDLLYEQGQPLEIAVKKALKELGCDLRDFEDKRNEDVRFIDPTGKEWICEIKGRKGYMKRDDIRQLDDWIKLSILNQNWIGYAGLIGNYHIEIALNERPNPISENEENALKRFGFSFISTEEIFKQLQMNENGNYKKDVFWKEIQNRGKLHN